MQRTHKYLGNLDALLTLSQSSKSREEYYHPALKNLGCVNVAVLREVIAPAVFRNAEQEITDIEVAGDTRVRAVPNKFKYPERSRGLQILRSIRAGDRPIGGRQAQNKTDLQKGQKPSEAYDLNTLVFGDSANQDNRVLPVRAGVSYSDALSFKPYVHCVDKTFHNRAMEDGTLFDAEDKSNSENLFSRHFVKPGTLLVQVLSTRGRVLTPEALDHLFLSLGLAGAYGGQTSTTGVNVRTRLVGVYGAAFERAATSPYEIVKGTLQALGGKPPEKLDDLPAVSSAVDGLLAREHDVVVPGAEAQAYVDGLVQRFEKADPGLLDQYRKTATKVGEFFDQWFGTGKKTKAA